jgi:hypothetical protein
MTTPTRSDLAIARFLRVVSATALELARDLESGGSPSRHPRSLDQAGLGSLQLAVARLLSEADPDSGVSPRELASKMDRPDEPNVRSALNRLADRGIAERVPGTPTQRWRLTVPYRSDLGV